MDTIKLVKNLLKTKMEPRSKILLPGNVCIFRYDAKDKKRKYDATPLCIVLRKSRSYVLGINFHWCPIPMRKMLVKYIFKLNKKNIKENKPLEVNWRMIKPMLGKLGMFPIIRLYIVARISRSGVKIPNQNLDQIISTKSATFIGKDENTLYKQAVKDYNSKRARKK